MTERSRAPRASSASVGGHYLPCGNFRPGKLPGGSRRRYSTSRRARQAVRPGVATSRNQQCLLPLSDDSLAWERCDFAHRVSPSRLLGTATSRGHTERVWSMRSCHSITNHLIATDVAWEWLSAHFETDAAPCALLPGGQVADRRRASRRSAASRRNTDCRPPFRRGDLPLRVIR